MSFTSKSLMELWLAMASNLSFVENFTIVIISESPFAFSSLMSSLMSLPFLPVFPLIPNLLPNQTESPKYTTFIIKKNQAKKNAYRANVWDIYFWICCLVLNISSKKYLCHEQTQGSKTSVQNLEIKMIKGERERENAVIFLVVLLLFVFSTHELTKMCVEASRFSFRCSG